MGWFLDVRKRLGDTFVHMTTPFLNINTREIFILKCGALLHCQH